MPKKKDTNIGWAILKFLLIVLAVALIILTIGWFIKDSNSFGYIKPVDDRKPIPDEENKANPLEIEKKVKEERLKEVEERITYIEGKKVSILKREKVVFISARFLIASLLVAGNLWYLNYHKWAFALDRQLNFNGAVVLVYSFFAFITYGTPSRFVNALKSKIAIFLKRKHIDLIEELEPLRDERVVLIKEIDNINEKLNNKDSNG